MEVAASRWDVPVRAVLVRAVLDRAVLVRAVRHLDAVLALRTVLAIQRITAPPSGPIPTPRAVPTRQVSSIHSVRNFEMRGLVPGSARPAFSIILSSVLKIIMNIS